MRVYALLVSFSLAQNDLSEKVQSKVVKGQATFRPPAAQLIDMVAKDRREDVQKLLTGSEDFLPIDINVKDYMGR